MELKALQIARLLGLGLVLEVLAGIGAEARALDTTEPFAKGETDAEVYLTAASDSLELESLATVGLSDLFTLYAGFTWLVEPETATPGPILGFYGPIIASKHFDLDWLVDWWCAADSVPEHGEALGVEVNLDATDSLDVAGLYSRAAAVYESEVAFEFSLGGYVNASPRHQFLAEFSAQVAFDASTEFGLGLGYNWLVVDSVELLFEFGTSPSLDFLSVGLGTIITL